MLKKNLPPSSLSVVHSVPIDLALGRIRVMILSAILLSALVGAALFVFTHMYGRRTSIPAESDAQWLEEHEQLNREIVVSMPAGTCTLCTMGRISILSNEPVHTYPSMLTYKDCRRLTQIICG